MPNTLKLIAVFEAARRLAGNPANRFVYSGWNDETEAVNEINGVLARLKSGTSAFSCLPVFFAPTGPLQELSLDSGWGDEFIALANLFDEAMAAENDC